MNVTARARRLVRTGRDARCVERTSRRVPGPGSRTRTSSSPRRARTGCLRTRRGSSRSLPPGSACPVGPERWVNAVAGQAIFHESQFTLLLDDFDARGNRLGFAYFHGRPGTAGFPEFDVCYRRLTQRHAEIDGVQVTNGAMESLVLETGIAAEKVHRIPIGIDPVAFPFARRTTSRRGPPGARASRHRLRRRLVPEGRRGLGRRAGAQADQGPGRPRRGGRAAPRARARPVVPAHRPLAGLREGGARARRHPVSAPLPPEPRVGGAGVRGDRPLHRRLARRGRAESRPRVDGDRRAARDDARRTGGRSRSARGERLARRGRGRRRDRRVGPPRGRGAAGDDRAESSRPAAAPPRRTPTVRYGRAGGRCSRVS